MAPHDRIASGATRNYSARRITNVLSAKTTSSRTKPNRAACAWRPPAPTDPPCIGPVRRQRTSRPPGQHEDRIKPPPIAGPPQSRQRPCANTGALPTTSYQAPRSPGHCPTQSYLPDFPSLRGHRRSPIRVWFYGFILLVLEIGCGSYFCPLSAGFLITRMACIPWRRSKQLA